jgi:hypothetical protein
MWNGPVSLQFHLAIEAERSKSKRMVIQKLVLVLVVQDVAGFCKGG